MSQTYKSRRRAETGPVQGEKSARASAPMIGNQSMEALMSGAVAPSVENMGHQVDLPGAVREKMESAFGADLSGVRLYESQAVADAGAQAITMGSRIGFAPGQLDFVSGGGQALLGHELSHVVSQARGEAAGNGFLNDHALEARADREGAMAAAGESVYSGPVTPLSASSVSAASGPMQAKKPKEQMDISEPELVEGPVRGENGKTYQSSRNAAIAEMVDAASPEQMQDPHLQQLVLDSFNQTMSANLQQYNDSSIDQAFSGTWRANGAEHGTYNKMLRGLASPHMSDVEAYADSGDAEAAIEASRNMVENDPSLQRMIVGAKASFDGSTHYEDDGLKSEMLMNNFMLRGIAPQLSTKGADMQETQAESGKNLLYLSRDMQRVVNAKESPAAKQYLSTPNRIWNPAPPAASEPAPAPPAASRQKSSFSDKLKFWKSRG